MSAENGVSPIEWLVAVHDASTDGKTFVNKNPLWPVPDGARGIFGGFILAQGISAAQRTVSPTSTLHNMHCTFIKPGGSDAPISYAVEPISDGRTFASRLVRATQAGIPLGVLIVSFQTGGEEWKISAQLEYEIGIPGPLPLPDDPSLLERTAEVEIQMGKMRDDGLLLPDPFEWRFLTPTAPKNLPPHTYNLRAYVRSLPFSDDAQPETHLAALAFLSDEWFLFVLTMAAPAAVGRGGKNVVVMATMNHSLAVHRPEEVRMDQWLFVERKSTWGSGGKVLLEQRFWDLGTGRLLASSWQEALLRLRAAAL